MKHRCFWGILGLLAVGTAFECHVSAQEIESTGPVVHEEGVELPAVAPGDSVTLEQALRFALERNRSLEMLEADLARARAEYDLAWSALLPTLDGTMTLTHQDHPDRASGFVIRPQDALSGGLLARMSLVNPAAWSGISAARVGLDATELTAESARQDLLVAVARSFYQALTARALIDVQRSSYQAAQRHLKVAEIRLVSGVGRQLEVIRARSELVRLRGEIQSAHRALENSRDALAVLIGAQGLPMPIDSPGLEVVESDEAHLIESATIRRADLQAVRKRVELSQRQIDTVWMKFAPSLAASWQLSHQFTEPSGFGSSDRSRWNAMLTLSVPLYNHARYAELDARRADLRKARVFAQDEAQQLALEIRTAKRTYDSAVDELRTAAEQAALAQQTLTLAENAYRSGTGSSLDVTDAARAHQQAQVALAVKRFAIQNALLELQRSIGADLRQAAGAVR